MNLILKTISWRMTATLITVIIAYVITGSFKLAGEIGAIEVVVKMVAYYIHERIWKNRLHVIPASENGQDQG